MHYADVFNPNAKTELTQIFEKKRNVIMQKFYHIFQETRKKKPFKRSFNSYFLLSCISISM